MMIRIYKRLFTIFILLSLFACKNTGDASENHAPIVFVGDSFIAFNDWNSYFDRSDIVNLGVAGDQTGHIYRRLDKVISLNPSKIFIMVGINDKPNPGNVDLMMQNYRRIFTMLSHKLPDCQIYIHSLLPVNYKKFHETFTFLEIKNEDIVNVNNEIKLLANEYDVIYIDIYSEFIEDGELKQELTKDGLHLSREGYLKWRPFIKNFLK